MDKNMNSLIGRKVYSKDIKLTYGYYSRDEEWDEGEIVAIFNNQDCLVKTSRSVSRVSLENIAFVDEDIAVEIIANPSNLASIDYSSWESKEAKIPELGEVQE